MRSLKYYSEDLFVKKPKEIDFPDYSNFKDINEAYSDFTGKVALANNLVKKLPTPPNKYGKTAVNNYFKKTKFKG